MKNAKELKLEYTSRSEIREAAVMFAGTRSSLLSRRQDRKKVVTRVETFTKGNFNEQRRRKIDGLFRRKTAAARNSSPPSPRPKTPALCFAADGRSNCRSCIRWASPGATGSQRSASSKTACRDLSGLSFKPEDTTS